MRFSGRRLARPTPQGIAAHLLVRLLALVHVPIGHLDRHPSCSIGTDPGQGWCCHSGSCGARGAIYDLASVLVGGPWGRELRGEAFKRARAYVIDVLGEHRESPQPAREQQR